MTLYFTVSISYNVFTKEMGLTVIREISKLFGPPLNYTLVDDKGTTICPSGLSDING